MQTTPFPDLAELTLVTHRDRQLDAYQSQPITLVPERPAPSTPFTRPANAYVAGVMCRLLCHGQSGNIDHYHSLRDGPASNHHPLDTVRLSNVLVVKTSEIRHLTTVDPNSGTPLLASESPIRGTVSNRAYEQTKRTIQHPKAPPEYPGVVYTYLLSNENNSNFNQGAPIAVTGIPVTIDSDRNELPAFMSLVEALYETDSEFVPVRTSRSDHLGPNTPSLTTVDHITYEIKPADEQPPQGDRWCMEFAKRLIISFRFRGTQKFHQVDASVLMTRQPWGDHKTYVVPGRLAVNQVADYINRGYWTENDETYSSWDELKYQHGLFQDNNLRLVTALMDSPEEAMARKLQSVIDEFHTDTPWPATPVTVTRGDGLITITTQPRPSNT